MDTKAAEFAQKLGARIVSLRKEHNYAQERLATLARMNKGYLSSVESGQRVPSVGMLVKLAKVLQVGVADIFVFPEAGPAERLWEEIRCGGSAPIEQLRNRYGLGPSPAALAAGPPVKARAAARPVAATTTRKTAKAPLKTGKGRGAPSSTARKAAKPVAAAARNAKRRAR